MCLDAIMLMRSKNSFLAYNHDNVDVQEYLENKTKFLGFKLNPDNKQLNYIYTVYPFRDMKDKVYTGYKVLRPSYCKKGRLDSTFLISVNINKWLKAENVVINDRSRLPYFTAFHILPSRTDARIYKKNYDQRWKIYKVEYKDVIGAGIQNGAKVILANQMKITDLYL